jgi:hypothetical protein
MKWITILLMKHALKKAIKKESKCDNSIIKSAYKNLIKNYKNTIMFLEADKNN